MVLKTQDMSDEVLATSTEGNTIASSARLYFFFSIPLNKSSAAVLPISKAGWVMVESGGFSMGAVSIVENTITFNSSGIETLVSLHMR